MGKGKKGVQEKDSSINENNLMYKNKTLTNSKPNVPLLLPLKPQVKSQLISPNIRVNLEAT